MHLRSVSTDTEPITERLTCVVAPQPAGSEPGRTRFWRHAWRHCGPVGRGLILTGLLVILLICEGVLNSTPGQPMIADFWLYFTAGAILVAGQATTVAGLKEFIDERASRSDQEQRARVEYETFLLSQGQNAIIDVVHRELSAAEERNAAKIGLLHGDVIALVQDAFKAVGKLSNERYADGQADAAIEAYSTKRAAMTGTEGKGREPRGVATVTHLRPAGRD